MNRPNTIVVNGNVIKINPINLSNIGLNSYVVIEKYDNLNFTTIDIVYGSVDIKKISNNDELRETFFKEVLNRENMIDITRKKFGLLPENVRNRKLIYNNDFTKVITERIFAEAYKETRVVLADNSQNTTNNEVKKKNIFLEAFLGSDAFEKSKRRQKDTKKSQETQELNQYVKNNTLPVTNGIIFYRSGAIVIEDEVCLRFNYITKDNQTKGKVEYDSFLVSLDDEDRLKYDKQYRENFVNKVLDPSRLDSARSVKGFPYIGSFTINGNFDNNLGQGIWSVLAEINKVYREPGLSQMEK